jgi:hypothetical protein
MAGMIRAGFRPSTAISANDTAPTASPSAPRTRSRRRPGAATSTPVRVVCRRHPDRKIEPLRPAEPALASDAERQHRDLIPQQRNRESTQIRDLNGHRQAFHAAMNEHLNLAASEDAARDEPNPASPNLRPSWRDAILRPLAPHRASVGVEPAEIELPAWETVPSKPVT